MSGAPAVAGRFETLSELMDAAAEQIGAYEAYVDGARRLSFAAWVRAADGVAAMLSDRGVARGDVVALHLGPCIDYAVAYLATARLGAITTGINPRLGPAEIAGIHARCTPRVVVSESHGALPVDFWGDAARLDPAALRDAAEGPPLRTRPVLSAGDPVAILWTSGTTGHPKGAWFDHRNLEAAVAASGVMTEPFDRRISAIPMVHAGYMAKLWEQLAMGVAIVLSPTPWSAESMLRVLVEERITVAAGVPTQWAKLVELPEVADADLSRLRIGLAATAPAPPELVERVAKTIGCPLVVRYAMTESPSITGTEPDDPPDVQYRTVGRPQQGVTLELVDDAGAPVAVGEVGRVRVSGPCVMRGYWGDAERTREALSADGRLLTSDLGRLYNDGNLILAGRVDDLYIRGGYNVYPVEVEAVLQEHAAVARAAVVGARADVIGEIGVAFVVPADPGAPPALETLRDWVGSQLADYKRPDRVMIVSELPLTAMLKVDKAALRDQAAES